MQRIFVVSLFSIFLVACGGTPPPANRVSQQIANDKPTPSTVVDKDIAALLADARENVGEMQLTALINITAKLAAEDCNRGIFAAQHLKRLLAIPQSQQLTLYRPLLQCYLAQQNVVAATTLLSELSDSFLLTEDILPLRYELALLKKQWLEAAEIYYQMSDNNRESALHIWQLLDNLDSSQLTTANDGFSVLTPWLELIMLQRSLPLPETQLSQRIQTWKTRHNRHIFAERFPDRFQEVINIEPIPRSRVAVLLPLSGRWQEQGEAIKSGILAAKFSLAELESSIVFYDSNQLDSIPVEELQQASIIIGPLLKENIDDFVTRAPNDVPVLYLNRVDSTLQRSNDEQYFYSLAPEDEAQQLALRLFQNGMKKPVVIASQTSAYQRMKQEFLSTWLEKAGDTPLAMDFDSNETLRKGIDQLLDIADSKSRIRRIENMLTPELHSEERNRRDVDAIVVFANPSQTELINPIIESSISPFADIVPVFASSRSYSSELNKNSLRDLRNLTFVEMPWMLPSANLRYFQNLTTSLWPERSDTERRLFAMGYDAFNVIPALRFLKTVPKNVFTGLTGTLALNEHNETTRELAWAAVREEEIQSLEMD